MGHEALRYATLTIGVVLMALYWHGWVSTNPDSLPLSLDSPALALRSSSPVRVTAGHTLHWVGVVSTAWTPQAAAESLYRLDESQMLVCKENAQSPFFMYADEGVAGLVGEPGPSFLVDVPVAVAGETVCLRRLYCVSPVSIAQREAFLPGWQTLTDDASKAIVNVWIGGEGVHTQLHYDTSKNILVQLAGIKTVVLVAPEHASRVRLFPELHRRARKAQLPYMEAKGNLPLGAAITVILRAGDALFIPPYYLHEVVSETCSVSVNVFSESTEERLVAELHAMPLPFVDDWSHSVALRATLVFLRALLSAADLSSLLHSRWPTAATHPFPCKQSSICTNNDNANDSNEAFGEHDRRRIAESAAHVHSLLSRTPRSGSRRVILENYAQLLIATFSSAEDVPIVLQCCV